MGSGARAYITVDGNEAVASVAHRTNEVIAIIAYSPCIEHGYDLGLGIEHQKLAVQTGYWPLYRFDPRRLAEDENPLRLDSGPPKKSLMELARSEGRFGIVERQAPARFHLLMDAAQRDLTDRVALYEQLAHLKVRPHRDV